MAAWTRFQTQRHEDNVSNCELGRMIELVSPAAASRRSLEPAGAERAELETGGPASTRQVFLWHVVL